MVRYRFTRAMRIAKNRDFQAIYEEGVRLRGPSLQLVAKRNALETARLGISVGKKKMPRAVDRNRFKRLVREAFRLNRESLPTGIDYLVIPLRGDGASSLSSLATELVSLGQKAGQRLQARTEKTS